MARTTARSATIRQTLSLETPKRYFSPGTDVAIALKAFRIGFFHVSWVYMVAQRFTDTCRLSSNEPLAKLLERVEHLEAENTQFKKRVTQLERGLELHLRKSSDWALRIEDLLLEIRGVHASF